MYVSALWVYPIKSCAGVAVPTVTVTPTGFLHDRQWLVVDGDNCFITQRAYPRMLLLLPAIHADGSLTLTAPGMLPITVEPPAAADPLKVKIWVDVVDAVDAGDAVGHWLSQFLGTEGLRLVSFSPTATRPADRGETYYLRGLGPVQGTVRFPDRYPYSVISDSTLSDLNDALRQRRADPLAFSPLSMRRFRPNIVVSGPEPYAEDTWDEIRIGMTTFRLVKACTRCQVITLDPDSGIPMGNRHPDNPLEYLKAHRDFGRGPLFGQHAVTLLPSGSVSIGDPVVIISHKSVRRQGEDKGPFPNPWDEIRRGQWAFLGAFTLLCTVLHSRQKGHR